ncbi:hypothetical protein NHX12_004013 [Muraenolepis orangiensis]|uniref:Uncharacterized protein n=1 Tax=Muraenolepis orangiensis TaxID=630683 RepID=A0A9Q0DVY7_9TELE|nr:hypothetical protein NHX12_004013 [Muraenolepis orangiensis]
MWRGSEEITRHVAYEGRGSLTAEDGRVDCSVPQEPGPRLLAWPPPPGAFSKEPVGPQRATYERIAHCISALVKFPQTFTSISTYNGVSPARLYPVTQQPRLENNHSEAVGTGERYCPSSTSPVSNGLPQTATPDRVFDVCTSPTLPTLVSPPPKSSILLHHPHHSFMSGYQQAAQCRCLANGFSNTLVFAGRSFKTSSLLRPYTPKMYLNNNTCIRQRLLSVSPSLHSPSPPITPSTCYSAENRKWRRTG